MLKGTIFVAITDLAVDKPAATTDAIEAQAQTSLGRLPVIVAGRHRIGSALAVIFRGPAVSARGGTGRASTSFSFPCR